MLPERSGQEGERALFRLLCSLQANQGNKGSLSHCVPARTGELRAGGWLFSPALSLQAVRAGCLAFLHALHLILSLSFEFFPFASKVASKVGFPLLLPAWIRPAFVTRSVCELLLWFSCPPCRFLPAKKEGEKRERKPTCPSFLSSPFRSLWPAESSMPILYSLPLAPLWPV